MSHTPLVRDKLVSQRPPAGGRPSTGGGGGPCPARSTHGRPLAVVHSDRGGARSSAVNSRSPTSGRPSRQGGGQIKRGQLTAAHQRPSVPKGGGGQVQSSQLTAARRRLSVPAGGRPGAARSTHGRQPAAVRGGGRGGAITSSGVNSRPPAGGRPCRDEGGGQVQRGKLTAARRLPSVPGGEVPAG